MATERRIEQVATLMREVAAAIIARELSFPPGIMVTVTRVAPSPDLYYATIFVTVFGSIAGGDAEAPALGELSAQAGLVQHRLNRTLRMRPVPRITFAIDHQEKRRERVEELLAGEDSIEGHRNS